MSLWFAGAESAYVPPGGNLAIGNSKRVGASKMNARSETVYKAHGKMQPELASFHNPRKTALEPGALDERAGWSITPSDRRQKRAVPGPDKPRKVDDVPLVEPSRKDPKPAPFALGDHEVNSLPYHQQKRRVSPPKSTQKTKDGHAEDLFVLKRSRTPPVSERNRPRNEGFCVLHGFDPRVGKFTREMMRVVTSAKHGKSSADWEREITTRREQKEQDRQEYYSIKGKIAKEREEGMKKSDHTGNEKNRKGRAMTPPATSRAACPFATGLPAPKSRQPIITSLPRWQN